MKLHGMPTMQHLRLQDSGQITPPMVTPPCSQTSFNLWPALPNPLRRQSSLSSLSSNDSEADLLDLEWTQDEDYKLRSALQDHTDVAQRCDTPFVGMPPSQLLHSVARALLAKEGSDWRHTLKQTRSRLWLLARQSSEDWSDVEATPVLSSSRSSDSEEDMMDIDATPRVPKRKRRQLSRQYSTDFMPPMPDPSSLAKLSDRLHSADAYPTPQHTAHRASMARSSSLSFGSPSFIDTASFPDIPPSPTRQTRAFSTSQVGPPSPTLSEASNYSGSSLFTHPSLSTRPSVASLGSCYGDSSSAYNNYGYPTPQPSAKRSRRPSLKLQGRAAGSRPLARLPTADSLPMSPSQLDLLPDSPTPFRLHADTFGPFGPSLQGNTRGMELDLASPFEGTFHEKADWVA